MFLTNQSGSFKFDTKQTDEKITDYLIIKYRAVEINEDFVTLDLLNHRIRRNK